MRLEDIDFVGMLAAPLRTDPTAIALARVVEPYLRRLATLVIQVLLLPRVYDLTEAALDALARDLHITWYDPLATLEVKRKLVADSDKVHMRLGTPYAIEQVSSTYFSDAVVKEWFEYGGEPYFFRVHTSNVAAAIARRSEFMRRIEQTKNVRSVFEGIQIDAYSSEVPIYTGCVVQLTRSITIPIGG